MNEYNQRRNLTFLYNYVAPIIVYEKGVAQELAPDPAKRAAASYCGHAAFANAVSEAGHAPKSSFNSLTRRQTGRMTAYLPSLPKRSPQT